MPLSRDEWEGTGTVPFAQRSQLSGAATERFRIAAVGLLPGAIAGLGARLAMGKNSPRAHPATGLGTCSVRIAGDKPSAVARWSIPTATGDTP